MYIRYLLLFLLLTTTSAKADIKYYVMSSTKSSVNENIDLNDLREIFLGNRVFWRSGERIYPAHVSTRTNNMKSFIDEVLSMSPRQYNKYWRRRLFSGKGHPPKELENDTKIIDFVKKTDGSIGLLSALPKSFEKNLYYFRSANDGQSLNRLRRKKKN
jgi:hypothetical protein